MEARTKNIMTSKAKFFLSLVCIHFSGTNLTMPNIDESKVKSFVVERRRASPYDYFTVNMKTNHTCTEGSAASSVDVWCGLFRGDQGTSNGDKSSCSCSCIHPFYAIIPPMQTCINFTRAALFGGKYKNIIPLHASAIIRTVHPNTEVHVCSFLTMDMKFLEQFQNTRPPARYITLKPVVHATALKR